MNAANIDRQMVMQLATVRGGQPWVCTVYFVVHMGRFYWLSFPERRHSSELVDNPKAAIAIVLKYDKPVVGVQAEGNVRIVRDADEVAAVLERYVAKYGQGERFVERFLAGTNKHQLYCLEPRRTVAFDEHGQSGAASPKEIIIT